MCALRRELYLDLSDLNCLVIRCKCGTTVSMDTGNTEVLVPSQCPGCRETFTDEFRSGLRLFRDAYREISKPRSVNIGFTLCFETSPDPGK